MLDASVGVIANSVLQWVIRDAICKILSLRVCWLGDFESGIVEGWMVGGKGRQVPELVWILGGGRCLASRTTTATENLTKTWTAPTRQNNKHGPSTSQTLVLRMSMQESFDDFRYDSTASTRSRLQEPIYPADFGTPGKRRQNSLSD